MSNTCASKVHGVHSSNSQVVSYCLYNLSFAVFLYSFVTLFEISTQLGDGILSNSSHVLPICDRALVQAQRILLEMQSANSKQQCVAKLNVHARMTGMYINLLYSVDIVKLSENNLFIR